MTDEKQDFFENKKDEIFYTLREWYMEALDCRGLNNDEIHDEFCELLEDIDKADWQFENYNTELLDKYAELLKSRKKLTELECDQFKWSLSLAINCLSYLYKVANYCPECGPKAAMEELVESSYWMGHLMGTEQERDDSGIGSVVKKAVNSRHEFNRSRKLDVVEWYRKNGSNFKSKDDAAVEVAHMFSLTHGTARKHLRGL